MHFSSDSVLHLNAVRARARSRGRAVYPILRASPGGEDTDPRDSGPGVLMGHYC